MTISKALIELDIIPKNGGENETATYLQSGLSADQAAVRLDKFGRNQLTEGKKRTLLQRIWAQVANVLVAILVVVAIVSAIRAITSKTVDNIVNNWIQVSQVAHYNLIFVRYRTHRHLSSSTMVPCARFLSK